MLVPLHEHRVQRPVEILAAADAGRLQRRERIEHRAGADRNARRPQRAGEMQDVVGKSAREIRSVNHLDDYSAARSSARTWSSSSLALPPSMRAMSSWYFNNTPSVSLTVAGSSAAASSSAS